MTKRMLMVLCVAACWLSAQEVSQSGLELKAPRPMVSSLSGLGVLEQAASANVTTNSPTTRVPALRHLDSCISTPFMRGWPLNAHAANSRFATAS